MKTVLFALIAAAISQSAPAVVLILDSSNAYSTTLEPGVAISQPLFDSGSSGHIRFEGALIALGLPDIADFTGTVYSQIGDGSRPGGSSPASMATSGVDFTIKADGTGNLYSARLLYFKGPDGGVTAGIAPTPDLDAGAALDVQLVPEPSSAVLGMLLALGGLARRSRS